MKAYIGNYRDWTWFHRFLSKIGLQKLANSKLLYPDRKIKIKTHKYDHWNADNTISLLVVPILKDLRANLHGCPGHLVEEGEDIEVSMKKWELILDKIIWAHEQIIDPAEDEFYVVRGEGFRFDPCEDNSEFLTLKWDVKPVINWNAKFAYYERIQEGLELFGKYYQNLWD